MRNSQAWCLRPKLWSWLIDSAQRTRVAIVEDGAGARLRDRRGSGWPMRLGVHALGIAEQTAGSGRDSGSSAWRSRCAAAFAGTAQSCQGVASASQASKSTTSPSQPLAIASFSASIIGAKRSWKLTAALSCLARQIVRISRCLRRDRCPSASGSARRRRPAAAAAPRHGAPAAWRGRRSASFDGGGLLGRCEGAAHPRRRRASRALARSGS